MNPSKAHWVQILLEEDSRFVTPAMRRVVKRESKRARRRALKAETRVRQ